MKTFTEKERTCAATFEKGGPYWHAFTSGKTTPILFTSTADFIFIMNLVALVIAKTSGVCILAFEVMNNHFHFIFSGCHDAIIAFWSCFKHRMMRAFHGMNVPELILKQVEDLASLRNAIVYVNRNGYVANADYTPFSYPWGTGRHYFLDAPVGICLSACGFNEKRKMFRCRTPELPGEWVLMYVNDGEQGRSGMLGMQGAQGRFVSPTSFCAIKFGMAMFRDAHHYFSMLTKNVEAYSELAADLDDGEFLTDAEIFTQVWKIVREKYELERLSDLSKAQKQEIARALHYEWRSSNGQIRRILGLSQYEVDSLFPLSKK